MGGVAEVATDVSRIEDNIGMQDCELSKWCYGTDINQNGRVDSIDVTLARNGAVYPIAIATRKARVRSYNGMAIGSHVYVEENALNSILIGVGSINYLGEPTDEWVLDEPNTVQIGSKQSFIKFNESGTHLKGDFSIQGNQGITGTFSADCQFEITSGIITSANCP